MGGVCGGGRTRVRRVETATVARVETTPSRPRVLVIGLDPYRVPGPWDPAPVAEAIARGMQGFAEAGVDAESCLVGLDGSDDIDAVVTRALEGRRWDVILVGGGIRKAEELLEVFERIVNLVHRCAPEAAVAFNATPDDIVAAAERWLNRPQPSESPMRR